MANLRWFRKHQKGMLVVFGVMLMGVFLWGMVVPFYGRSGNGRSKDQLARENQPIVQWSGGTLTRGQLQNLLELHYSMQNFQDALIADPMRNSPLEIPAIPNSSPEFKDRAIFARYLFAEYAKKQLGMVVSDNAVYDFLSNLSGSDVDQQYLMAVARRACPQIGYNQLHEYIKMELAATRFQQFILESFYESSGGAAPASVLDAWQAFLQNEKQIECAVEAFVAADYLPQVTGQPSTTELKKLYEEGKTQEKDPIGERPGFKRPRKVRVEYVSADANAFLELAIQDVTAEQVLAEYNRLVEAKDPLVMEPITPSKEPTEKLEGEKLEDEAPAPDKENMEKSGDPAPAPKGEGDNKESKPADAAKPTEAGDNPPAKDGQAPSNEGKDSQPSTDEKPKDGKDGGQVFFTFADLNFVSFVGNPQETQDSAPPKQDPAPTPESGNSEAKKQDETPPSTPPEKSDAKTDAPQEEKPADATPPATQDAKAPEIPAAQDPDQRPKKLDAALELAIKQRLKRDEAMERMQTALENVQGTMQDYALDYAQYLATKDLPKEDQVPLPARINLEKIAGENHLKYGETPLCTLDEILKEPVGSATEFLQDPNTGQFRTRRAADDLFVNFDKKQLFGIEEIKGFGETYVYWLTDKVDSRIPSFEDAQDDIIAFWKLNQALDLAKLAATKVRDELKSSGKKLTELYPEKAKLTGGFRWFQSSFNQINYGSPKGVTHAGEEFMSAAFSLKPDESAVAVNDDRSAAYVVQLIAGDPRTEEQLRDLYLEQVSSVRRVVPSATNAFYNRKSVDKLIDQMNDDLKVEWLAY